MKLNYKRESLKEKLKINIELNNERYIYEANINDLLETVFKEICNQFKINSSNYYIKIKNSQGLLKLNSSIKDIVNKNPECIFLISKKTMNLSKVKDFLRNTNQITIGNIALLSDFKKCLQEYISNNTNLKYDALISDVDENTIKIYLKNPEQKNILENYINFIKYKDNRFRRITIQKNQMQRHLKISTSSISNIKSNEMYKKINTYNNRQYSLRDIRNIPKIRTPKIDTYNETKIKDKKITDILKQISSKKKHFQFCNKINWQCQHDIIEEKLINDYYRNQKFLRNSSPYLSTEDQRIIEEKENKKLFISNKGFINSVGNYSNSYKVINNYVQMTPSENPLTHEFRKVNKKKWITIKGFINS